MTILLTRRLRLRPPRAGDAEVMAAHLNDFEVAGNLARVKHPYTIADARTWLTGLAASPAPIETGFMIELEGGDVAGHIGFHDRGTGVGELGYYLGVPHWGRGYMFEAGLGALGWYFGQSGTDLVASGAFAHNVRSLKVQQRLGFTETGRSKRACLARGQALDHVDTALSRAEFDTFCARQAGS